MDAQCCYAAYEPTERLRDLGHLEEPCRMATGANCDDKMAADDETLRALDYIREMCLDRPCPSCKSEVVDEPQEDLRQCRACGHLWGFDDTQNLEEFVREFARMEPCLTCGNYSLDEFEVVQNEGRQELICRNCQTVQGTERVERDRNVEGFEVVPMDRGGFGYPGLDLRGPDPRREMDLACPFCPDMTNDFFEKQYDRDELVRALCPSCSYVVYYKGQNDAVEERRAEGNGVRCAQEDNGMTQGNGVLREDNGMTHGNGVRWEDNGMAKGNGNGMAQGNVVRWEGNGMPRGNDVRWEANGMPQGNDVRWEGNGMAQGNDVRLEGNGMPQGTVRCAQEANGTAHGNRVRWEGNGMPQRTIGCAHEANGTAHGNGVRREENGMAPGNVRCAQENNGMAQENVRCAPDENGMALGNGVRWAIKNRLGLNGRHHLRTDKRRDGDTDDPEKVHLFPQVKRAMRYLSVKPIELAQHCLQACSDSVLEKDENLGPRLKTLAENQGPIMAEQLGWTIGTAVGNVMFRSPQGAALTGSVGSIVGRGFCDMFFQTMQNRRR